MKVKLSLGIILVVLVTVALIAVAGYQRSSNKEKEQTQGLVKIKSVNDVGSVVDNFGDEQAKYNEEISEYSAIDWNKDKLDKVHFNLIYADKIGSFGEVYNLLVYIDVAQKSGIDIDDNSFGIDEQERNNIKQRADIIVKDGIKDENNT